MKKFLSVMIIILILTGVTGIIYNIILDKPVIYKDDAVSLIFNGIKADNDTCIKSDENIYIKYDYLLKSGLMDIHWEPKYKRVSIVNDYAFDKISYNNDSVICNGDRYIRGDILYIDDNELYLNAELIKLKYISRLSIDKLSNILVIDDATQLSRVNIRTSSVQNTVSRNRIIYLEPGEVVQTYDYTENGYVLCKTDNERIGFVRKSSVDKLSKVKVVTYNKTLPKEHINLSWDLITKKNNEFETFDIPNGLDILSPTWYDLSIERGMFTDISSDDYTSYVHDTDRQIWPCFTNNFDPDLTSHMLNNPYNRTRTIMNILDITIEKGYDGVNLDFENIYLKDKEMFSLFVKELYCTANSLDIPISIDITILSGSENWSMFYDRGVIGRYSDYVILMAYDEHVSGTAGSVGSIPWVEYGIRNLLESVEPVKVVLAVPFYTRLWEEYEQDGVIKVKSTSLRIKTQEKVIEDLKINLVYDELTGQNYGEKCENNINYIIWSEDTTSLSNRLKLKNKYNLVGSAIWAFSFGTEPMWDLIK